MSEQHTRKTTVISMIMLGVMIGLMLTGTAVAASYLTKPKANKLYLNNTKTHVDTTFTITPSTSQTSQVNCPTGWQAVGGGWQPNSTSSNQLLTRWSAPVVNGDNLVAANDGVNPKSTGWAVRIANLDGASSYTYSVGVICSK